MDSFDAERAAWVIVCGYAVAFALVFGAWRGSAPGREKRFWLLVGLGVLALGINKQLDLQTQFTAIMRDMARADGWFEMRRDLQAAFIRWLLIGLAIGGLALAWLTRELGGPVRVALLGVLLLCGFVALRAASFHHVDMLLRTMIFGTRAWVVIELAGVLLVGTGAGWSILRERKSAV